ncbi:hypothetical protein PPERSA_12097 [Pseudocohnilembus persalinus]|uniref:Uncharacterized protein n=1 Tax=Pseudocohnilembus persalinus TaxID=266149 RepID=A0A0V0R8Z8_PSEPJ|nr:hypothetical protein PPERSA_12097 [Pseudocohnilembus persalinus]|eukprot:KRX10973.1 hypothetical protein PPERSA_12097 [Pseudocohnilembus persalinus]
MYTLSFFGQKTNYWKNGLWWFTKPLVNVVGESRWDYMRVFRRVQSNRFYYARQQLLYECFIDHPDLAQWCGIYPKVDSSHGFPFVSTYEMYRDFQENTLNSDGSFAQYMTVISVSYIMLTLYQYMVPYYWQTFQTDNDEFTRLRMKDALASCIWEELGFSDFAEWGWQPHDFAYNFQRAFQGYSHPDDTRALNMASYNRSSRYRHHANYDRVGDYHHMTYPR